MLNWRVVLKGESGLFIFKYGLKSKADAKRHMNVLIHKHGIPYQDTWIEQYGRTDFRRAYEKVYNLINKRTKEVLFRSVPFKGLEQSITLAVGVFGLKAERLEVVALKKVEPVEIHHENEVLFRNDNSNVIALFTEGSDCYSFANTDEADQYAKDNGLTVMQYVFRYDGKALKEKVIRRYTFTTMGHAIDTDSRHSLSGNNNYLLSKDKDTGFVTADRPVLRDEFTLYKSVISMPAPKQSEWSHEKTVKVIESKTDISVGRAFNEIKDLYDQGMSFVEIRRHMKDKYRKPVNGVVKSDLSNLKLKAMIKRIMES